MYIQARAIYSTHHPYIVNETLYMYERGERGGGREGERERKREREKEGGERETEGKRGE